MVLSIQRRFGLGRWDRAAQGAWACRSAGGLLACESRQHAAVNDERLPGDERRTLAVGQEDDRSGHLLGPADAAERRAAGDLGQAISAGVAPAASAATSGTTAALATS